MSKFTPESLKKYIGKSVDIKQFGAYVYINERAVRIDGNSLITEYYHHIKTREDGLLRDHWIDIKTIEDIRLR
jgi:hypothetical protein